MEKADTLGNLQAWVRHGAALLSLLLFTALSAEVKAQADTGDDRVTILGTGEARSTGYSAASGAAIESLPIVVAQGRKGVHPNLGLLYTSSGGVGALGTGWSLETGSIHRSSARGIPTVSEIDEFVFSLGGSAEILIPQSDGSYRPRYESTFRQYMQVGDHWEVTDAQGIRYFFGTSEASREPNLAWMLDRVEDAMGNSLAFNYALDAGYFYVTSVVYTGNTQLAEVGQNRLEFEYETRPDQRVFFSLGVRQERRQRLHRISNFVGAELVRRYTMTYSQSSTTGASLVRAIDMVGTDDSSSLRVRSYDYLNVPFAFSADVVEEAFPVAARDGDGRDGGVREADVNGDGFVDVLDNGTNVWLGDGTGGFTLDAGWSASLDAANVRFVDGDFLDAGGRIVDVNGDARPDLLVASPTSRRVLINTGLGWDAALGTSYSTSLSALSETAFVRAEDAGQECDEVDGGLPDCDEEVPIELNFSLVNTDGDATGGVLADVNADGLTDIAWSFQNTEVEFLPVDGGIFDTGITRAPVSIRAVYLNTGTGWTKHDRLTESLRDIDAFVVNTQRQGFDMIDVNGDGAADIVNSAAPAATDRRAVWLCAGNEWVEDPDFTNSIRASSIVSISGTTSEGLTPIDYNGDSLLDYLRADNDVVVAYRNAGLSWVVDSAVTAQLNAHGVRFADGDGIPPGFALLDVNGDTVPDLVRNRQGQGNSVRFATGFANDNLFRNISALGAETLLEYVPSTTFEHTRDDGVEGLPTILPVVSELKRRDGRGNEYPVTVAYSGGAMGQERLERAKFRAFAASAANDARGVTTVRRFAQSEALGGTVLASEISDAADILVKESSFGFVERDLGDGVTQLLLVQTDERTIDPGGELHVRTQSAYDEHLNVIELIKFGDVNRTGDEGTTRFEYAKNFDTGVVSALTLIEVFDAQGALHSSSRTFFDESHTPGYVAQGLPTRTEDLISSDHDGLVVQKLHYDEYGNLREQISDRGGRTRFFYEDSKTFIRKTLDPLGRRLLTDVDLRFGRPTREVDANGNATTREFDAFGRVVKETLPGDECSPLGTRSITFSPVGDPISQSMTVRATETPGEPDTLDTTLFFDGLGRVYRAMTEGAQGIPVAIQVDFDDADLRAFVSEPAFVGDPVVGRTIERDALRRVVRVESAVGATTETVYRGAERDSIDRRGNTVSTLTDGFGRPLEVRQSLASGSLLTSSKYDVTGKLLETTSPAGETVRIRYNALGRRTKLIDPASGTFMYRYDGNGNLVQQTGPTGKFRFKYNLADELLERRLPDGQVIRYEYGRHAHNGNTIARVETAHDSVGRIEFKYDGRGNIVERRRETHDRTYVSGYSYDSMGRLRKVSYPDGFQVNYAYNPGGFIETVTDSGEEILARFLDYNAHGRARDVEFGNGVESHYAYDSLGLVTDIDTLGPSSDLLQDLGLQYDLARNVEAIIDGRDGDLSQVFTYDELNRLTRAVGGYGDLSYRYDEIGNLIRKGSLLFLRNHEQKQRVDCAVDLNLVAHNKNGLLGDKKLWACAHELLTRGALESGEAATLQNIISRARRGSKEVGESLTLDYDRAGNIVRKNDQHTDFDAEGRLVRVSKHSHGDHEKPSNDPHNDDRHQTDDDRKGHSGNALWPHYGSPFGVGAIDAHSGGDGDNKTGGQHKPFSKPSIAHPTGGNSGETLEVNTYGADGERVFRMDENGRTTVFIDGLYEEDFLGRHVQGSRRHVRIGPMIIATITPNRVKSLIRQAPVDLLSQCQLKSVDRWPPQAPNGRFHGDSRCALVTPQVAQHQMSIFGLALVVGVCLWRRRFVGRGWCYLWRATRQVRRKPWTTGLSILLVGAQLGYLCQAGLVQAAQSVQAHELAGPSHHNDKDDRFYYHHDHLGNVNVITNEDGNEEVRREYRPFGEQFVSTGSEGLEISFSGHEFSESTGLYYFGMRYYDSQLGRFISPDTIVPDGSPQKLHRYVFAQNNPIRFIDHDGRDFWDWVVGGLLILAGIAIIVVSVVFPPAAGIGLALGLALGAAAGALIGAGVGYLIATIALGLESTGDILAITFAGAVLGAAIGAGIGAVAAGGLAAPAGTAGSLATQAAIGAATGSIGGSLVALQENPSPKEFLGFVLAGALVGAVTGAAFGSFVAGDKTFIGTKGLLTQLGLPIAARSVAANQLLLFLSAIAAGAGGFGAARVYATGRPEWLRDLLQEEQVPVNVDEGEIEVETPPIPFEALRTLAITP